MATPQDRQRLARAVAECWRGGAGPTHSDLDLVFDAYDLDIDEPCGSKFDRVHSAIVNIPDSGVIDLIRSLLELLNERQAFDPQHQGSLDGQMVLLVSRRLKPFGYSLDSDGVLASGSPVSVAPEVLVRFVDVREHIRRLQLATAEDDTALMLGASKELLETSAKFVLTETMNPVPPKFPALLSAALEVLGLSPRSVAGDDVLASATKRILGGLQQVGLGVNDLRNGYGTGHGKVGAVKLNARHARLAANAAITLATIMMETFDEPSAPWRQASNAG